jgi:hypothetical protein
VRMMFLPLMLFLSCSVLAVLMQVLHQRQRKDGRRSLVGRTSALNVMSNKQEGKGTANVGSISKKKDNEDEDLVLTCDLEKSA